MGIDIRVCTAVECTDCWYSAVDGKWRHHPSGADRTAEAHAIYDRSFDVSMSPDYPYSAAGLKIGMLYRIDNDYRLDGGSYAEFDAFVHKLYRMSDERGRGDDFCLLSRGGIVGPIAAGQLYESFALLHPHIDEFLNEDSGENILYLALMKAFAAVKSNGAILIA